MLFNSPEFLFLFLPISLAGYYGLIYLGYRQKIFVYLVLVSFVFYSFWSPPYAILLALSVGGNYAAGSVIERYRGTAIVRTSILTLGILANLAVLGYYKYTNFIVENINYVSGTDFTLTRIILPLAISFYTFQQIAYLVDVARGEIRSEGIARFVTFVVFFPQLIAGPIVHYKDMMPQFFGSRLGRFATANITVGLIIFAIGLFKKTIIADSAASFSTPVFDAVHAGTAIGTLEAWKAVLCYKIQLYFDFSGYSDMAVGLSRMFGVLLPLNFHSPLRAFSIIDYWRRWHMTLQSFIASYIYQPISVPLTRYAASKGLSKNLYFIVSVALPTFIIFIVSGIWHGAAWTFVIWGAMHGFFVIVNEYWRSLKKKSRRNSPPGWIDNSFYFALTLSCAILASTMFRAEAPMDAVKLWAAMLHMPDAADLVSIFPSSLGEAITEPFVFIVCVSILLFFFPNSNQIMTRYRPVLYWERWKKVALPVIKLQWRTNLAWCIWLGVVFYLGVAFMFRSQSEFIYFNF